MTQEQTAIEVQIAQPEHLTKSAWSATELLEYDFPQVEWCIDNLLPVGFTFLAGPSKIGKSWLCLQWAIALGSGGNVFGTPVSQRKVLYLALEDSPRRLKNRLIKQAAPRGVQVDFRVLWRRFGPNGGMSDLAKAIAQNHYALAIVDTFSEAAGMADQMDIARMTNLCGELRRIAHQFNAAIVAVDHHTKQNNFGDYDPSRDVRGSGAKGASADTNMGMYRETQGITLKIHGKDVEERELSLRFDRDTCTWQSLGNAGEVRKSRVEKRVCYVIDDLTACGEVASVTAIADALKKDKGNVSRAVRNLVKDGIVIEGDTSSRPVPLMLCKDWRRSFPQ